MTEDVFADRVAKVRQRFVSSLHAKIDQTFAALPGLGGVEPPAVAAVADAYRTIHGIVGIGRTVGFPAIGVAAHDVEEILRPPYRAGRGLSAEEISLLKNSLQALRAVAARELQPSQSSAPTS
jgi:HPt (histidine-containing phosphotransfer) domain-containing protein